MHERPIGDLVDALRALGCAIEFLERPGYPPLAITAAVARLVFDRPIAVRGNVSSQFLSALLMALPLRAGAPAAVVEVEGELISKPYVDITLQLLERFGVAVERDGWRRFSPARRRVALAGPLRGRGRRVLGLVLHRSGRDRGTRRGARIAGRRRRFDPGRHRLCRRGRAMGATIVAGPTWLEVRRGRFPLAAITLDCNAIPDGAMTLAALALFADGTTRLENIASWRVKETDRLAAMATELRKVGAGVEEGADWLAITPPTTWHAAAIDTYDDHRMAMAMSLAAFNAAPGVAAGQPVRIDDPRCVAKTWPDYFETLFAARGDDEPRRRSRCPPSTARARRAKGRWRAPSPMAGHVLADSGAPSTAPPRSPHCRPASAPTTRPGSRRWRWR